MEVDRLGYMSHANITIAVQVCISAYMLMVMHVMLHRHCQCKAWRATAGRFVRCKHSRNSKLRDKHNQHQGKYEFLVHSVSFQI